MNEREWQDEINEALATLASTTLHLEHDSIVDFRILIGRLDHMVFHGFHILHKQRQLDHPIVVEPPRPSIDLTD